MEITLCVGSSCHLKGAPAILTRINALLQENHLENQFSCPALFVWISVRKARAVSVCRWMERYIPSQPLPLTNSSAQKS